MNKSKKVLRLVEQKGEERRIEVAAKTKGHIEQRGGDEYKPITIERVGNTYIVRRYRVEGTDLSKPIIDRETAFKVYISIIRS